MAQVSFIAAAKLIELLKTANPRGNMYVMLAQDRLTLGIDPLNPTSVIDFSEEAVRPISSSQDARTVRSRASRQNGNYLLEIKGSPIEAGSLKEALAEGLRAIEKHRRGTLDKLSAIKPRTKRIVAREPQLLFDQPELVAKYAEQLDNGWWFGTNNSADETNTWLRRGAELAGLEWGKDFQTSF